MHWILQFIVRYRTIFSLLVTTSLSLFMLGADSEMQQQTARMFTMTVFYPVQFTVQKATRLRNSFAENRRLKKRLAVLNIKTSRLEEASEENKRLRKMLEFKNSFEIEYDVIPARVYSHNPSDFYRSITIDAGKNDGVEKYMTVVNEQGVAGKVIQVMRHLSLVQLLKDPAQRVSVMVKRNRTIGIMKCEGGRNLVVDYRVYSDVAKGDTIITSGLGGIFPDGLLIGTVKSVREVSDQLFHTINKSYIEPAVDFKGLEDVFVIKHNSQWSAFRHELDSLESKK